MHFFNIKKTIRKKMIKLKTMPHMHWLYTKMKAQRKLAHRKYGGWFFLNTMPKCAARSLRAIGLILCVCVRHVLY